MRVIVAGGAGVGKSTVARFIAKKFGLRHVSAGDKIRLLAKDYGFSTNGVEFLKFGDFVKNHPEVDKRLDELILRDVKRGNCVIDSRLTAFLFKGKAYRILLKVPDVVAAKRNSLREGVSVAESLKAVVKRNKADVARFKRLYGVDINDLSVFNLIIDTSHLFINDMCSVVSFILRKIIKRGF